MTPEQIEKMLIELSTFKHAADAAQQRTTNFQQALAAALTDIAFKEFRELQDMEAHHIHAFGDIVSSHTWRIANALDQLHCMVKQKQNEG